MHNTNLLKNLSQRVLDFIFPPPARVQRIRNLSGEDLQSLPPADSIAEDFRQALFSYQDKVVRDIVQAAKYDGSRQAAEIMGRLLYDNLLTICAEARVITDTVTLVPIPLSGRRYRDRGFNHCRRITQAIKQRDGGNAFAVKRVLKKTRSTPAQTGLSRTKRKTNLAGCFALKETADVTGDTVILIDDVTTTGATFKEAQSAVQAGNPERVLAVAFAH